MEQKQSNESSSYLETSKIINDAINKKTTEVKKEERTKGPKFKLFLYIKKELYKYKSFFTNKVRKFFSKVNDRLKTTDAREIKQTIKFVFGYGLLIWTILYTFFDYAFNIIYVFGSGSLLYIFYDVFDYIVNKLRGTSQ